MATTRVRTPSDEVAGSLVDAAVAVLEADGPAALTVRRIAADAGVSPQGVYNHFDGKHGIVEAVFVRGFDALATTFDELPAELAPMDALALGAHRYRALARDRPGTYAIMFDRPVADFVASDEAKGHARTAFDGVVHLVAAAMAAGDVVDGDPVVVAQQLWSAIHGAVSLELRGLGFVDDVDRQYALLVGSVLRGIATAPDPS